MSQTTRFHWRKVREHEGEGLTPLFCEALQGHTQGSPEYTCEEMAIDFIENVMHGWTNRFTLTTEKINDDEFFVVMKGSE